VQVAEVVGLPLQYNRVQSVRWRQQAGFALEDRRKNVAEDDLALFVLLFHRVFPEFMAESEHDRTPIRSGRD
jgi:hypothetical protein